MSIKQANPVNTIEQGLFTDEISQEQYVPVVNTATRGQAVAPVVIGILALCALFVPYFGVFLAFILSIVGTVLGWRGAVKGSKMARVGQTLSVAALVVSSIILIVAAAMGSLWTALLSALGLDSGSLLPTFSLLG